MLRALGLLLTREPGRWDFRLLAGVLVVAGALWGFAAITDEVVEGETHALDRAILLALRDPASGRDPLGPRWLEVAARDVTSLGSYAVLTLITAAVVGFLALARRRGAALLVVAAVGGGTLLSNILKLWFERSRPEPWLHAVEVASASFPSGHAMLSTVAYLTLGALLARVTPGRRLKLYLLAVALLLAGLVGLSRVYLGVHWPTDVLAGWCVGAAWALACWLVARRLQRRGHVRPAGDGAEPP